MPRILKSLAESTVMLLVWAGLLVLFGCLSENFLTAATFRTLGYGELALVTLAGEPDLCGHGPSRRLA